HRGHAHDIACRHGQRLPVDGVGVRDVDASVTGQGGLGEVDDLGPGRDRLSHLPQNVVAIVRNVGFDGKLTGGDTQGFHTVVVVFPLAASRSLVLTGGRTPCPVQGALSRKRRVRSYFFGPITLIFRGRDGNETSVFGFCVAPGSLLYGTWACPRTVS